MMHPYYLARIKSGYASFYQGNISPHGPSDTMTDGCYVLAQDISWDTCSVTAIDGFTSVGSMPRAFLEPVTEKSEMILLLQGRIERP